MSEEKFTKGEWKATKVQDRLFRIDSECCEIAKTIRWNGSESHKYNDEVEANAHLIAAAPEMYEMLDEVLNVLGHELNPTNKSYIKAIKELLAKSRGEKC